jgi:hypothetical protein
MILGLNSSFMASPDEIKFKRVEFSKPQRTCFLAFSRAL